MGWKRHYVYRAIVRRRIGHPSGHDDTRMSPKLADAPRWDSVPLFDVAHNKQPNVRSSSRKSLKGLQEFGDAFVSCDATDESDDRGFPRNPDRLCNSLSVWAGFQHWCEPFDLDAAG